MWESLRNNPRLNKETAGPFAKRKHNQIESDIISRPPFRIQQIMNTSADYKSRALNRLNSLKQ